MNVCAGTITSSPGPMSRAMSAVWIAVVPELTSRCSCSHVPVGESVLEVADVGAGELRELARAQCLGNGSSVIGAERPATAGTARCESSGRRQSRVSLPWPPIVAREPGPVARIGARIDTLAYLLVVTGYWEEEMDLGITRRVALITGAGRGIGAEIARRWRQKACASP